MADQSQPETHKRKAENEETLPQKKVAIKSESTDEPSGNDKPDEALSSVVDPPPLEENPKDVDNNVTEPAVATTDSAKPIESPAPVKKPAFLTYVPHQLIDDEVRRKCIKPAKFYKNPGKADIVRLGFDYVTFARLKPECPPIRPNLNNVLFTNQPLLKFAFGYSPKPDDEGKVQNNARYQLSDFVNDEARSYKDNFLIPMEDYFSELVFENRANWLAGVKLPKNAEITKDTVENRFTSGRVVRNSESHGEYLQHKLKTQTENVRQGIKEDPYTAFLDVWKYSDKSLLAKKLTEKNSTNYDVDGKIGDGHIIIDKDMYGSAIYSFDKLYFSGGNWGVTTVQHTAVIADKSELVFETEGAQEYPMND